VPPIYRAGFNRKENKYYANLVGNSSINQGEVLPGLATSGVKGFFIKVKMSTDSITDPGRYKELFAVSSNYTFASGY
jgi:hypothetical protein